MGPSLARVRKMGDAVPVRADLRGQLTSILVRPGAAEKRLGSPRRLVVLPDFGHGEAGFSRDFAYVLERLVHELLGGFPTSDIEPPVH